MKRKASDEGIKINAGDIALYNIHYSSTHHYKSEDLWKHPPFLAQPHISAPRQTIVKHVKQSGSP